MTKATPLRAKLARQTVPGVINLTSKWKQSGNDFEGLSSEGNGTNSHLAEPSPSA